MSISVVIPTMGRPSLQAVLAELGGPSLNEIVVVDDRSEHTELAVPPGVRVLRSGGGGPAAARNVGWRAVRSEWVAFLDDDVVPGPDWVSRVARDLGGLAADVGASQGRIEVPVPLRPTDWERGTARLATAAWITADMAYRRAALLRVGGFDERFPRAYREDADLALRVLAAGYRIVRGSRTTTHPVRPAGPFASVRAQRGNADNALMRRRHGRGWRARIGDGPGRLGRHALTTVAAVAAVRWRSATSSWAALVWAALTAEFALRRILPGPRTASEIARMAVTSVAIPPVACWHRLAGEWRWRAVDPATPVPAAVLFDRDDTLVHDVPYNNDPAAVRPVPGARAVLDRLRAQGVPVGIVSNQSGIARGHITPSQLAAVNARVEELLGPFGTWQVCVHGEDGGCGCRKPEPGLVKAAAEELGVAVERCVLIGDTGADIDAAAAAGARGILVPTARTLAEEVHAAPEVAPDLAAAVALAGVTGLPAISPLMAGSEGPLVAISPLMATPEGTSPAISPLKARRQGGVS